MAFQSRPESGKESRTSCHLMNLLLAMGWSSKELDFGQGDSPQPSTDPRLTVA